MAETINYAPLLSPDPPEGLIPWTLQQGGLSREYLIYRAAWQYEPLEDRNHAVVEVVCSACGRSFHAHKLPVQFCRSAYTPAPFGWRHPDTLEAVISGQHCLCPYCGAKAETVHVRSIPRGIEAAAFVTEVRRVPVPDRAPRLALIEWRVLREIDKEGRSKYSARPWTAWVVEERRIVRLMGYTRGFCSTLQLHPLEQRRAFQDDYGEAALVLPWPAELLEGTTAENCKLDLYIAQGGRRLVSYLALWRKRPAAENLVVQGWASTLDDLISSGSAPNSYGRRSGIPKLPEVDWTQRQPHRMLGLTREQFRRFRGCPPPKLRALRWANEQGLRISSPEEVEMLEHGAFYRAQLLEAVGPGALWRGLRYLSVAGRDWPTLRDYWQMAADVGEALDDPQLRWPRELHAAHDRVLNAYNRRARALVAEGFDRRLTELAPLAWADGGILIRPAAAEAELVTEGRELHHCVARYAADHAAGRTAIFFVRQAAAPDVPWYTLELDAATLTVRQNRGLRNCARVPEVEAFEAAWLEHLREVRARSKQKARIST